MSAAWGAEPSAPERLMPYFQPPRTDVAAISPDGATLAYTVHEGGTLYLQLVDLAHPATKRLVAVADDFNTPEYAPGVVQFATEKHAARLEFIRWITPRRLVFLTNEGRVFGIDADGSNARTLATPRDIRWDPPPDPADDSDGPPRPPRPSLPRQPVILEVLPRPKNQIILEARGRSPEIFQLDAESGQLAARGPVEIGGRVMRSTGALNPRGEYPLYDRDAQPRVRSLQVNGTRKYTLVPGRDLDALVKTPLAFHVTGANYFGARSLPLGFGYDPQVLYFASSVGRDTFGVYALDVRTGERTPFKIEHARYDLADFQATFQPGALVLDRHRRTLAGVRFEGIWRTTQWIDDELQRLQLEFDRKLPGKNVEIVDWDAARTRFVLFISNQSDPGGWFVFHNATARLTEIARRAPWITPANVNASGPFAFTSPAGVRLSGYLTLPRTRRIERAPLLVLCAAGLWSRHESGYSATAQAFASMGFAVLQVNTRGSRGFGRAQLEAARGAFDRAPVDDLLAAIDWVTAREKLNPKLVALYGRDYGGYVALRALELHPERFRCAVVEEPITDLGMLVAEAYDGENFLGDVYRAWFGADRGALAAFSAVTPAAGLALPVLLLHDSTTSSPQIERFARELRRGPGSLSVVDVSSEFHVTPKATARVFAEIEGFLNENVYRYATDHGEAKEVP